MTKFAPEPTKVLQFSADYGRILTVRRSGAGKPLVLIHGTGTDSRRWLPVLPAFERHFTVYAVDRSGYGDSEDMVSYCIEAEFGDIVALADSIGNGQIDVVGHSYGALCALGAACTSHVVRRLVIYEPPLQVRPGDYFGPSLVATMRAALARNNNDAAAAAFAVEVLGTAPDELDVMRRLGVWESFAGLAPKTLRELESVDRISRSMDMFCECRTPTLILIGDDSPPQYRATAEALRAMLLFSRIVALPNQRHGAINAAPELFANEVIRFLIEPSL